MSLSDVLSLFISRSFLEILCVRLTISHPQTTKIKASPIFLASKKKERTELFYEKMQLLPGDKLQEKQTYRKPFLLKNQEFQFPMQRKR